MDDPIIIPLFLGARPSVATGESARWGPPMLVEIVLTTFTVTMAGAGLIAEAVLQAPPSVTWPMVAFSAVGLVTLIVKQQHQYRMAALELERNRGELAATKAELETLRAIRRSGVPSEN